MHVEEAAALVKLADASDGDGAGGGVRKVRRRQAAVGGAPLPDAFDGHGGEVPLVDPFLQQEPHQHRPGRRLGGTEVAILTVSAGDTCQMETFFSSAWLLMDT